MWIIPENALKKTVAHQKNMGANVKDLLKPKLKQFEGQNK
jgi:hypothetical protein